MHKTTSRVVEALCNLTDKVIEWPTKDEKKEEKCGKWHSRRILGLCGKGGWYRHYFKK